MNHYACYALKCEDGYASTQAVENCSFNGGTEFSFGLDFYYDGKDGVIFSQKDSVCCRIRGGQFEWEGVDFRIASSSLTEPVIENAWNHLDIVYQADKVQMYLNAIAVQETTIQGEPLYSAEEYRFLEDGNGYLRNVRMVDHAMTQDEVIANLLTTEFEKEKLWLYLPFDSPTSGDQGKYGLKINYNGLSRCESLVKALRFNGNAYALLDNAKENPGSEALPEFSIALRIFAQPSAATEAVLIENSGTTDALCLYLTEGQTRLALKLGAEMISFEKGHVPLYQWTDIVLTVGAEGLSMYVNGALAESVAFSQPYLRTGSPRLVLGKGFSGYMDYVAMYGKAVPADEVCALSAVEPYLYDDGIRLLYLFHGEAEANLLGEGELLLQSGAEIGIAEGTVYEEKIEPFQYRVKQEFSGNDFEKWQADLVSDICAQFTDSALGVSVEELSGGEKALMLSGIAQSAAAQEIFINYTAFTAVEIASLVTVTLQQAEMYALLAAVNKGKNLAFMLANMDKIMKFQMALGMAAALAFILAASAKARDRVKEPEEPPYVPAPPEPEKGYEVEIVSMQFYNGSKGSIPLRTTWNTAQPMVKGCIA